jgi:hypothetical protein
MDKVIDNLIFLRFFFAFFGKNPVFTVNQPVCVISTLFMGVPIFSRLFHSAFVKQGCMTGHAQVCPKNQWSSSPKPVPTSY